MDKEILIIAHRGESYDAPENTIASINLALERGARAIEIDVQLSKDGKIVVFHDATTLRLGGRFKRVSSQTVQQLKELDVGNHKGIKWAGERIPLFEDVLNILPENVTLFVEVKGKLSVLEQMKKLENIIKQKSISFISFDAKILSELKQEFPTIPVYFIYENKKSKLRNSIIAKLIDICKINNFDGLDLDYKLLTKEEDVIKIKNEGLKIFTWTVDKVTIANKLAGWGVDGITSNRAAWLKEQLKTES